jgi:hypothetical protein
MYQYKTVQSSSSSSSFGPWDILPATPPEENTENNNLLFFRVSPGLIANTLPNNWNQIFQLSRTDPKTFFIVRITISSSNHIDSATIRTETTFQPVGTVPVRWGLPSQVDVLFGIVEDQVPYRTVRPGDISVSSKIIVTTITQTTEFIPYTNFYTIVINGGENELFANFGGLY